MRMLLTKLNDLSPIGYRRFMRRAQVCGLFPDHLVAGSPYLALNALVLTREDRLILQRLTEEFAVLLHEAATSVAADVPTLVELGFPWAAAELLAAETPRMPLVGRFDFMQDADGRWWLLEFNADTPSGVREAVVIDEMVHSDIARDYARPTKRLAPLLIDAFRGAGTLGLVTDASELEDLSQMAFTQRLLSQHGVDVTLGDIDNLKARSGHIYLLGRRLDALYRYVPFEGMFGTPAFASIYDAVLSGKLNLLNGLYGLLLQNKGLLARFTHENLPSTWRMEDAPVGIAQSDLVAKQVFGREGEEVFFGDALTPEAWDGLRKRRTYIAQQRVHSVPLKGLIPCLDGLEVREGYATVGCFAVNGRFAGYYTRFGGPITDNRAKWIATFEES